jgi:hypothetical protein
MNYLRRLEKLEKLLKDKKATHTNPVEIGIADLEWLIFMAYIAKVYHEIERMDQELELDHIERTRLRSKN